MTWWSYPTNFSNGTGLTSVTSVGTLIQYSSYVTEGWFAYGFLLILFIIVFALSSSMNSDKALTAASFITFIFSVYFLRLDMINLVVPFILIIMTIAGALASKESSRY